MRKGELRWLGALLIMVHVALVLAALAMGISSALAEDKPTPTPMPPAPMWEAHDRGLPWGTVHGRNVNFREGPGKEYRVCFQLSTGCAVEVVGEYHGWYQVIRYNVDHPVWVYGEYLEIVD